MIMKRIFEHILPDCYAKPSSKSSGNIFIDFMINSVVNCHES